LLNFISDWLDLSTHAYAAGSDIIDLITDNQKTWWLVWLLQSFSSHYDHSSGFFSQTAPLVVVEGLHLRTHYRTRDCFDAPNHVEIVTTVIVNHLKLKLLSLFEGVSHNYVGLEVRIEVGPPSPCAV
jgi:hypothetical protein